jgi:hypothetical protein
MSLTPDPSWFVLFEPVTTSLVAVNSLGENVIEFAIMTQENYNMYIGQSSFDNYEDTITRFNYDGLEVTPQSGSREVLSIEEAEALNVYFLDDYLFAPVSECGNYLVIIRDNPENTYYADLWLVNRISDMEYPLGLMVPAPQHPFSTEQSYIQWSSDCTSFAFSNFPDVTIISVPIISEDLPRSSLLLAELQATLPNTDSVRLMSMSPSMHYLLIEVETNGSFVQFIWDDVTKSLIRQPNEEAFVSSAWYTSESFVAFTENGNLVQVSPPFSNATTLDSDEIVLSGGRIIAISSDLSYFVAQRDFQFGGEILSYSLRDSLSGLIEHTGN